MTSETPGVAAHLREAIALNRARRPGYVRRGGPAAGRLSRLLVGAERALLPSAWGFDRAARPWAGRGVPVIVGDVVSMDAAPPPDAPLERSGAGGEGAVRAARATLRGLRAAPLELAARQLGAAVARVEAIETEHDAALAMTRHLLESAWLGAANGARYAAATGGGTARLSRRWVAGHLRLVPLALRLDARAHPLHRAGVGILANDVPPIPRPARP